jgi:hypothetical protein
MQSDPQRQATFNGCCLLTMLAFGASLTVLVLVLAVSLL